MALATQRPNSSAVVFRPHGTTTTGMDFSTPNQPGAFVFHPPRRRKHHRHHSYYHNHSDCDTDSSFSRSSCSSDSDDDDDNNSPCYHVSHRPRHHATRRRGRSWWPWPRGVLTYPGYSSPWATTTGAGVVDATGLVSAPTGIISTVGTAATVLPQQLYLQQPQVQAQQQQQQQQQPRRYGYRRFHYQGGERVVQRGCGQGHHHHHHHRQDKGRARSPRRCILPRFGRWLIGDPPEQRRWQRRCEDGSADCCGDGCGEGAATTTTPTVHHEDEYWGPGQGSTIPNWACGSQNSPWRYGGPNGNNNPNGPDTVGPGGTIEEVEEGGTAPAPAPAAAVATTQPLPTTTVVPVPVPTAADTDPYDQYQQQQTNHYHLHGDDRAERRRHAHRHHDRRRCHRGDDENNDGILGLVERERRRDSERQMADADASHRREAMMMELVDRARSADRDRGRGGGGGRAGLDARDILGVLLEDVAERRGQRRSTVTEGGGGGDDDGLKGALDALSRRVDDMVLSGREEKERAAAPARRTPRKETPRVKFTRDGDGSAANSNNKDTGGLAGGKKRGIVGGKIKFSRRGRDGRQDDEGCADTDTEETSEPSLMGGGRGVRARGRALRRAGSESTSVD